MIGLFGKFLDDAAVFPPGNLAVAQAVPAHRFHKRQTYAPLVGTFVVAGNHLGAVRAAAAEWPAGSLMVSLTTPLPQVRSALDEAASIPAIRLVGLEVSVSEDVEASVIAGRLGFVPADVEVFVEVPRDGRRDLLLAALSGTRYLAKFRTGGVKAHLYPDETELAESIGSAVREGVPFKATAGLHHALRNTDPETGFEQHGFLNLLTATAAARSGAGTDELVSLLAERNPHRVVDAARLLDREARESFRSFGTCSVNEPVGELIELGLLPATCQPSPYQMKERS